jgi:hypothetical protein
MTISRRDQNREAVMKNGLLAGAFLFLAGVAQAQHGTAPGGYYPLNYHGDTWTGTVTAVSDQTREIVLSYSDKDKTEVFTGLLQAGYKIKLKNGSMKELKPSDIPIGAQLFVYYTVDVKKVDGKRVKTYEIFKLTQLLDDRKK